MTDSEHEQTLRAYLEDIEGHRMHEASLRAFGAELLTLCLKHNVRLTSGVGEIAGMPFNDLGVDTCAFTVHSARVGVITSTDGDGEVMAEIRTYCEHLTSARKT